MIKIRICQSAVLLPVSVSCADPQNVSNTQAKINPGIKAALGKLLSASGDYPQLSGVANVEKFNSAVKSIIKKEINNFRQDFEKYAEKDRLEVERQALLNR